ncbi:hypothetical protein [Roseibium sp. SCP14]|uniref:hypothetical protein n=1 Tax=Roseibium sp. SCP14 TaxID=3141375 RepID=UPI003337A4C4
MIKLTKLTHPVLGSIAMLFLLSACQSGGQSDGGLEAGSAAPPVANVVVANEGPDGPPGECVNVSDEGTSLTPGCP